MKQNNAKNKKDGMLDPAKTVVDGKAILPAGTPKQENPYGIPMDPPVPNRAHTEMKCPARDSKVP